MDDILQLRTSVSESGRWSFHTEGSGAHLFCRSEWGRLLHYVLLHCPGHHVFKAWRVSHYVRGAEHWLVRLVEQRAHLLIKAWEGHVRRVPDFCVGCQDLWPRRGIDHGTYRHWPSRQDSSRFLEGHTISSTGLVLVLALHGLGKRQGKASMTENGSRFKDLLGNVLGLLFSTPAGLAFDITAASDDAAICSTPPRSKRHAIEVEGGLSRFAEVADEPMSKC